MNQVGILKEYGDFVAKELLDKDDTDVGSFLNNYPIEDCDQIFDLITSVDFKLITKEEYNDLLEFKWMYESLND